MNDTLMVGGHCCINSCGYTGDDNRVANAINWLFAPEIAVAGLSNLPTLNVAKTEGAPAPLNVPFSGGFSKAGPGTAIG
ncbi:MAG: hypothetical protein SFW64_08900 [Alphaproteobacteria bacterium]|nr:hypothetical protein [Alphaproteobacteria bacterium]